MKPIVAISIPTGVGAQIGGFAGDFGYLARKFSRHFYTILNPNAVNGGILSAINNDMAYLEGYLFDEFFFGSIGLTPLKENKTNKIGVIFESSITESILNVHLNTLSALKMVQGADITGIEYTKNPVGVEIIIENGISYGNLAHSQVILDAASKLIEKEAEAIAVVCNFNEDAEDADYENGVGIDPIGGVEAVISHLITKEFKIPSAHAPAFNDIDISTKIANPKVSSELISSTYLPCIIQGLSIAPKIEEVKKAKITYKDVNYLIVPFDALGSKAVLGAYQNGVKIVCVKNKTALNITPDKLKIEPYMVFDNYEDCLNNLYSG